MRSQSRTKFSYRILIQILILSDERTLCSLYALEPTNIFSTRTNLLLYFCFCSFSCGQNLKHVHYHVISVCQSLNIQIILICCLPFRSVLPLSGRETKVFYWFTCLVMLYFNLCIKKYVLIQLVLVDYYYFIA